MNTINNDQLIYNITQKDLSCTNFGNHPYKYLWYVCNKNKICITFTPRGGCSVPFQQFLDLNGLLDDAIKYKSWLHDYRTEILDPNIKKCNINTLILHNYTFIKFIINPYIRAVSIYRANVSNNLSFREYLKEILNNTHGYFNNNDKFHSHSQYIDGEKSIITHYIKIDKNETQQITLFDGSLYILDANKYSSTHHGKKNINNTTFCGDLPKNIINNNLPKTYKYFYDDEIQHMVETIYEIDIQQYNYSFNDFMN